MSDAPYQPPRSQPIDIPQPDEDQGPTLTPGEQAFDNMIGRPPGAPDWGKLAQQQDQDDGADADPGDNAEDSLQFQSDDE